MKKVLAFLLICALIPAFALAEATPAEPEKKTVSGVLVDAAMHTILMEDWNGEQVYFYKEGDEDLDGLSDGLYIGKIIECEYVDAEDGHAPDGRSRRKNARPSASVRRPSRAKRRPCGRRGIRARSASDCIWTRRPIP